MNLMTSRAKPARSESPRRDEVISRTPRPRAFATEPQFSRPKGSARSRVRPGRITSNFVVSSDGEVTDDQVVVLFIEGEE